jgi:hypothetical protein
MSWCVDADLGVPHERREVVHWPIQDGEQQDGYGPARISSHTVLAIAADHALTTYCGDTGTMQGSRDAHVKMTLYTAAATPSTSV